MRATDGRVELAAARIALGGRPGRAWAVLAHYLRQPADFHIDRCTGLRRAPVDRAAAVRRALAGGLGMASLTLAGLWRDPARFHALRVALFDAGDLDRRPPMTTAEYAARRHAERSELSLKGA